MAKADEIAAEELSSGEEAAQLGDGAGPFIVDEVTDEVLRLRLDNFEGPFEVLLYLIRSQEIDIFDIPIAKITDQYLRFLDMMREENLDVAGEYLVLAATLIQIKSKMLLPVELDEDDEDIEDEDPRMELVEKLIAYRQYRDAAGHLGELEAERSNWFTRNVKPEVDEADEEDEYVEVSLFDLVQAFKGVMHFFTDEGIHRVELESVSVDEKIDQIQQILEGQDSVAWLELFHRCGSRMEQVCVFLAILELCRMGAVRAHQHRTFGDIRLFRKPPEAPAE